MPVRRIVANLAVTDLARGDRFYRDVLGLERVMDLGWIVTYAAAPGEMAPQVSLALHGGSGMPAPDLSIEVDDLDATLQRVRSAGFPVVYGPANEPWGVRRFYTRDPFGKLINILSHG